MFYGAFDYPGEVDHRLLPVCLSHPRAFRRTVDQLKDHGSKATPSVRSFGSWTLLQWKGMMNTTLNFHSGDPLPIQDMGVKLIWMCAVAPVHTCHLPAVAVLDDSRTHTDLLRLILIVIVQPTHGFLVPLLVLLAARNALELLIRLPSPPRPLQSSSCRF